mgnify:CR=1 FL=1
MYLRTKKRKNKEGKERTYLYLAKMLYRKKGRPPKQKIVAYLGPVIACMNAKKVQPEPKNWTEYDSFRETLKKTISSTLLANGFFCHSPGMFLKRDQHKKVFVDTNNQTIQNERGLKVCLAMNNGFLCDFTLQRLLSQKLPETTERGLGKHLAKSLIEAGIEAEKELFLILFQKLKDELRNQTIPNNSQQSTTNVNL